MSAPYPEGVQSLVFDPEQRSLNKWCQILYAANGNVGSVPYPEGVEPLPFDSDQRLEVKINAIYKAIA